ncbi:MAG: arginine deiminase family protein [Bacillota bacterium]
MQYGEREERWFAVETPFEEEISQYWGDWGVASECGRLEAVLLRRPGAEIEDIGDPSQWRWTGAMDPEIARAQHDEMARIYREAGAEVHYVHEMRRDRPNALFMRDLVFMTPEGAIVGRPAIACRRGEERYAAAALARLGVPIVRTVTGIGTFEGACAMWVDRETVILGTGVRCNPEGARQVEEVLTAMGVTNIIPFPIPYAHAHVDGLMNMVDHDLALIFPWQTPYDVWRALVDRGIRIIEAPSIEEVKEGAAINLVVLGPRRVLLPAGNPLTRAALEAEGVETVEIDISEIRKGWGALHCMTAFLKRSD